MSLLPSKSETSGVEADPRVVGVDSDDADDLLSALSSETARRVLAELHEDPAPPGELAERVDTSLQNVQYHLENMEEAGVVRVVDTAYSEKGREMDVYAPADQPLVIFAGDEEDSSSIRAVLSRLLGGLGVLALGSLAVQYRFGRGLDGAAPGAGDGPGPADGGAAAPSNVTPHVRDAAPARTPTPTETVANATGTTTETVTETARTAADSVGPATAGVPPGLLFFLGGATVLALGLLAWYAER